MWDGRERQRRRRDEDWGKEAQDALAALASIIMEKEHGRSKRACLSGAALRCHPPTGHRLLNRLGKRIAGRTLCCLKYQLCVCRLLLGGDTCALLSAFAVTGVANYYGLVCLCVCSIPCSIAGVAAVITVSRNASNQASSTRPSFVLAARSSRSVFCLIN